MIVGVCAAGKSTLAQQLRQTGRRARTIAQEHSCIPDLWQRSGAPVTIYLHASFGTVKERRLSLMHRSNYEAQLHRLRLARSGAGICVDTTHLTPEEVYRRVMAQLPPESPEPQEEPGPDERDVDLEPQPPPTLPIPDEPGEESEHGRYDGLPIPDEL